MSIETLRDRVGDFWSFVEYAMSSPEEDREAEKLAAQIATMAETLADQLPREVLALALRLPHEGCYKRLHAELTALLLKPLDNDIARVREKLSGKPLALFDRLAENVGRMVYLGDDGGNIGTVANHAVTIRKAIRDTAAPLRIEVSRRSFDAGLFSEKLSDRDAS